MPSNRHPRHRAWQGHDRRAPATAPSRQHALEPARVRTPTAAGIREPVGFRRRRHQLRPTRRAHPRLPGDAPYNSAARTRVGIDDQRHPNRLIAQALIDRDYVDVAWHLHQQTRDPALLRRTGSDDRIDRIYGSDSIASALSNYHLLDSPAGASDHHGVAAGIDTDKISRAGLWTYR